jgi:starvation-inducible outer membrane lipoprotein
VKTNLSEKLVSGLLAVALVVSLAGCQAIPKEAKIELAKPVDCSTAEQDIAILEKEHASVAKMFLDGVTAVTPYGAVISILTLQEKDKLEIAIGEYNHKLKRKIEEIKTTCGLE